MDTYYSRYEPIFGSWYIKKKIGSGSAGSVYLIEREDMGIRYQSALKCITIPGSEDEVRSIKSNGLDDEEVKRYYESVMKRVSSELTAMNRLKGHSNIVNYEDHIVIPHDDRIGWDILIRMELLTPLLEYNETHPLTEDDTIRLGMDMCRALELCNRSGMIHRDIKPENMFVSKNGDFKLGDFGISRMIDETKVGLSRKGTHTYMAPEVFKGEAYGVRSDIYSLGLVLYKFLNGGRNVFLPGPEESIEYEDNDRAFFKRMSGEQFPPPATGSDRLKKIVAKAGAFSPSDRYRSAEEMLKDLDDLVHDIPEPVKGRPKRKTTAVIIAALLIAAVSFGIYMMIPKEVTDVTGIGDSEEIKIGDSLSPEYVIEPDRFADEEITFTSDNEDVFTVDENGRISALSVGKGVLGISVMGYEKEVEISVTKKVTDIDVGKKDVSLYEGDAYTIEAKLSPEEYADEKVTYTSSDKSVASVNKKGKVTAKKTGNCTVTVSSGGSSEKVKVTVIEEPVYVQPQVTYSNNKSTTKKKSSSKSSKSKKESSEGYFDSDDDEYF